MAARRRTAHIPDSQRVASRHLAARVTPSMAEALADMSERYDLPTGIVLEVLRDLATGTGRLDAALFAAMVLHEDPAAYERAVGRPASEDARGFAARSARRSKTIMARERSS